MEYENQCRFLFSNVKSLYFLYPIWKGKVCKGPSPAGTSPKARGRCITNLHKEGNPGYGRHICVMTSVGLHFG